jgi:N-acyl-D-aspartate/D-glutamate deacylase
LRPGLAADVVVFDPDKVRDLATWEQPLRYSEGVSSVIVNGQIVLDEGRMTSARPGRPLRRRAPR